MVAELDRNAAQDEQPQHDHQRQIESAEAGSVERGESEVERAAGSEQPDFVAIPYRTDRAKHGTPFLIGVRDQQVRDPGAEIETIQHHVSAEHQGDKAEPGRFHRHSGSRVFGPLLNLAPDEEQK